MTPTRTLTQDDLRHIALGGCFFGSGGGGTLDSAFSLTDHFRVDAGTPYYPSATVPVVDVDQATEGETAVVAYLGAPIMINTARYPHGPDQAIAAMGKRRPTLAHIAPPESGALGFVVACLVAARHGLSVIDADGAGRAVPSLPNLTYSDAHISPNPAFLVNQARNLCIELDVTLPDTNRASGIEDVCGIVDNLMRPIVSEPHFHQFGGLALWAMSPEEVRRALPVRGTLDRARRLGRMLAEGAIGTAADMVGVLGRDFGLKAAVLIEDAVFLDAEMITAGGFDVGKVFVQDGDGVVHTVFYQNESLLVMPGNDPRATCMAPDSIAWFVDDPAGQRVFSNSDLVTETGSLRPDLKGCRVAVIGIAADKALCSPTGTILPGFQAMVRKMGYLGAPVFL